MSQRKHAFVVHLWFDDENGDTNRNWRGSIEALPTRQRLYFSEIGELIGFLTSWIGRHYRN